MPGIPSGITMNRGPPAGASAVFFSAARAVTIAVAAASPPAVAAAARLSARRAFSRASVSMAFSSSSLEGAAPMETMMVSSVRSSRDTPRKAAALTMSARDHVVLPVIFMETADVCSPMKSASSRWERCCAVRRWRMLKATTRS